MQSRSLEAQGPTWAQPRLWAPTGGKWRGERRAGHADGPSLGLLPTVSSPQAGPQECGERRPVTERQPEERGSWPPQGTQQRPVGKTRPGSPTLSPSAPGTDNQPPAPFT